MTTAASPLQRLGLLWRLHWRDLRRLLRYSLVLVAAPHLGQRCVVLHLADALEGFSRLLAGSWLQVTLHRRLRSRTHRVHLPRHRLLGLRVLLRRLRLRALRGALGLDEHAGCFFVDSNCVRSEWRLGWDVGKYLIVDALQFGRAPDCLAVEGKRWPWRIVGGALFSWCGGRGRQVGGWYDFPGYAYDIAGTRFSG